MKVKVFNWHSEKSFENIRQFTREVNNFLKKHEIIDVNMNTNDEKVETWFCAGVVSTVSYVIKYKDKPCLENGN